MPYPPQYRPRYDLASKNEVSPTEVAIELADAAESINQLTTFVRALSTSDAKIKPAQIIGTMFVVEQQETLTASQSVISYPSGVTVDPLVGTVGVFLDGVRLDNTEYTVNASDVTLTTPATGGEIAVLEIHDNADSVFSVLASILASEGASLVGLEDVEGNYGSSNVEDALAEVKNALDAYIALVGDLSKYLKADVAVPWEVDQDASGKRLQNLSDGVDPSDAINLSQLQSLTTLITDVQGRFVKKTGDVMSGPLNMNGNPVLNLPLPTDDAEATNKEYVDSKTSGVFIPQAGRKDTEHAAQAEITGPLGLGQGADDLASDPQDSGATIWTIDGVPKPALPSHIVNKKYVDDADTVLQDQINNLADTGNRTLSGCEFSGIGALPDISAGGYYEFEAGAPDDTVITTYAIAASTEIRKNGNIVVNGTVTGGTDKNFKLYASGNITINASAVITCKDFTLEAGGTITVANGATITATGRADYKATGAISDLTDKSVGAWRVRSSANSALSGIITVTSLPWDEISVRGAPGSGGSNGSPGSKGGNGSCFVQLAGTVASMSTIGVGGSGGGGGGGKDTTGTGTATNGSAASPYEWLGGTGGDGNDNGTPAFAGIGGIGGGGYYLSSPTVGGNSGGGQAGGGGGGGGYGNTIIDIVVTGDLDMQGLSCTISGVVGAAGGTALNNGTGGDGGDGGGGCFRAVCSGNMNDGSATANPNGFVATLASSRSGAAFNATVGTGIASTTEVLTQTEIECLIGQNAFQSEGVF